MVLPGQRGIACVKGEIHNVLVTMDASTPSSGSGFFDILTEASDMSAFTRSLQDLHDQLGFYSDLASIETTAVFRPFFTLIESREVPWQARAAALLAVHKFLLYELVVPQSLSAPDTMNECATALVVATSKISVHRSNRELLLLRALELFLELVRCSAGVLITDESLFLAFEQMIALRLHPNAEDILGQFVLVIFSRVRVLKTFEELSPPRRHQRFSEPESITGNISGYGPAALVRILRFIATLIDPAHNEITVRLLGLRLINMCLETAGTAVGNHSAMVSVVQDDICKQILQNAQTNDSAILTLILRIVFDLFATLRKHIRVQLEVFFTSIHIRIASNPSAPLNQRRLILQSIVEICHEPNLLIGLYRNYDCEIASTNMFEDLIRLLNRLSLPESFASSPSAATTDDMHLIKNPNSTIHVLALESLLAVVNSIAKRFSNTILHGDDEVTDEDSDFDDERLSLSLQAKADFKRAATLFNECGHKAVGQIQAMNLVEPSLEPEFSVDPSSMAKFLLETPGLDKRQVGAYIGKDDRTCSAVLDAYLNCFEMQGLGFVQALRSFMESFVIPGEAQMISRIMEHFAKRYFSQNSPGPIADEDAAFVLAFSVIMLNTDAHNPGVKTKMSFEQFARNNRGINKGADFPHEFLQSVYNEIVMNEIRIVSASIEDLVDHSGHGGVNSAHWEQLVRQSRQAQSASFRVSVDHSHGKAMFKMVHANFAHLISFYLASITDPKIAESLTESCHLFSRICILYDMRDPFNGLIINLCRNLIDKLREMFNSPGNSIKAVFVRSRRTHRCLLLVLRLVMTYGPRCLCEGWMNVIHMIVWLRQMDLLPQSLCHMEDICDNEGQPLPSFQSPSTETSRKPSKSIAASFFSSIWLESSDEEYMDNAESPEGDAECHTDHESENILMGLEAVHSCGIEQIFTTVYPAGASESLRYLVQTLILLSDNIVAECKSDHVDQLENFNSEILNENSAVFCLERLSNIVENNSEQLVLCGVWNVIIEHFRHILTSFSDRPSLFIERAVVNLLRLCIAGDEKIIDDAVLLLPSLLNLPPKVHAALSDRLAFGLSLFLRTRLDSISDSVFCNVCEILGSTRSHPSAFVVALDTLEFLCRNSNKASELSGLLHVASNIIESPGPYLKQSTGIALLFAIHKSIQRLTNLDQSVVFADKLQQNDESRSSDDLRCIWMSSISCLCRACISSTDYTAQIFAVDCLTMCLIAKECHFNAPVWVDCFDQLLFLLIQSEAEPEIVVRIMNMVFKVLLHRLPVMVEHYGFLAFWSRFLSAIISPVLQDIDDDTFCIHVQESLKNMLLVITNMTFSGGDGLLEELLRMVFDSLSKHRRLQRFCEAVKKELETSQEQDSTRADIRHAITSDIPEDSVHVFAQGESNSVDVQLEKI